jgi:peptidoglycan/xylan/chitin deacetylase (PgdA/CDA1 family)
MYHSISDDLETGVGAYYRVATSPARFSEQMQWIADAGRRAVTLEDGMKALTDGTLPTKPLVAVTFDDGFRDFHTAAWPVLNRHRFLATMYLPTGYIQHERKTFLDRQCMTWAEVRELRREGIQFGSHTVNHPKLYNLSWSEIEQELSRSKQQIELELGEAVSGFAYPFAFPQEDARFTEKLSDMIYRCGYANCATTAIGRMGQGDNPMWIRRLPVNQRDDRALFLAKLRGEYDWLGHAQLTLRRVRSRLRHSRRQETSGAPSLAQSHKLL